MSRQTSTQISGGAGVYQATSISPQAVPNSGGSLQQLPNLVGFTAHLRGGLTAGVVVLTTNSWRQETDLELITPIPDRQQRLAYSADSAFSQRLFAIGAGSVAYQF